MKRLDYLSWDEYFMGIALLSAQRSKDPSTQVGACIANRDHKILSVGYNGMPTGCHDDVMAWEREGAPLDTKYLYVCHAELNAILNIDGRLLFWMTKSDHPERDPGGRLLVRQIRRHRLGHRLQADV